ncbi:MAG TPA: branched-chain amino acid ABC transporter permease, partial [Ktedonobacteraceae bacterium]|nr:branched-chain amino acid ABC transporter permease [Ktedonobacteraceae bacterium]
MKPIRISGILAATVLLALFPVIFSNPAITTVAVFTLLFAAAATGWNIFSGYTGYISIGHAAYYGLGAYFFALFCQLWKVQGGWMPFLLVPLVGLATVVCAAPVGWIALKTRTHRFLIITVAIFVFSTQIPNFLGNTSLGGAELSLPIPVWSGAAFNEPFYYIAFSLLALALAASWWIRRSNYGLALLAIRDDEDRALGMGLRTDLYKLSAFLLSAFFISMVGAVSAYFLGFVAPSSAFDTSLNLLLPLLAMFGGIGTQLGPALGALVLVPLQQNLTLQFGAQNWDLILFGAVFLLIVLLMPEGVLPTLRKKGP